MGEGTVNTNGGVAAIPEAPPEQVTHAQPQEMLCPKCNNKFVVQSPVPELCNGMTVSFIAFAHPEPQYCPHCGTAFQMQIAGLTGALMKWVPVAGAGVKRIIQAPPGMRLPPLVGGK